jgi:uncharacterized membrane protein
MVIINEPGSFPVMERPGSEGRIFDILAEAFLRQGIPPDLGVIILWIVAAVCAVFIPVISDTPLRLLFGLPLVLFIPGYLVIAALFPGKGDIDTLERIALSLGLSIAIVPLIGLALNYTPWGIRLDPVILSLALFSLGCAVLAHLRRAALPAGERYVPPFRETIRAARADLFSPGSTRLDRILSVLLVIAIAAAVAATLWVIAVPREGERFTEFFILGGKGMAGDYPERIVAGRSNPMYIGIGNHEYRAVNYTVETWLLDMEFNRTLNSSRIRSMERLDRIAVPLGHNETTRLPYSFTAPGTGYNRIEFLLFNETVPGEGVSGMDRVNRAYRDLHLWLTVYPP